MLKNKSILITGGTGSFGQHFAKTVLRLFPSVKRLVVFSRDELKQFEMQHELSSSSFPNLRYFLGDIRDKDRLRRALEGIDIVVHAAALKQVPAAEYNPFEFIKTNVIGAQNLIEACLDAKVSSVISLSTDKASAPINLYGATKLCADKLFTAANNIRGSRNIRLSTVRYGNVMGSRGSVVPFFLKQRKTGILPITHPEMTRFTISLEDGVAMVLWALNRQWGGEIFVPKIPSYRIMDIANVIGPDCKYELVGLRPGEKVHEELITTSDSINTVDLGKYYAILPTTAEYTVQQYAAGNQGIEVPDGFSYDSGKNPEILSREQITNLLSPYLNLKTDSFV